MGFISEFKQFALRGNVVDLAVGVVMGAAFGNIISSMVNDIITPAILTPVLHAAKLTDLHQLVIPGTAIKYGKFISEVLSFSMISFALFLFIKAVNKTRKKENPTETQAPDKTEYLLTEIRDLLKK